MATIDITALHKHFGATHTLRGIELHIGDGEFVVFVGPSGCGKSTLLRVIAGLESASSGQVHIGGKDCTEAPPSQRQVAMVFQSYALYPHMTVQDNLSFGMRMRGVKPATIQRKLDRAIAMLQLEPYLQRRPGELSGGQCQRVAIGRAIVQEPGVFLFDEPLSNLDAELRLRMRLEIAALHRELGTTMVYVTHDQVEAMTLAQRIVVLRDGAIEQVGSPMALYHNPANVFVAGFIGSPAMNLLPARFEAGHARLADGTVLPLTVLGPPQEGLLGVRPEHLEPAADGALALQVQAVERLGASTWVHGLCGNSPMAVQSHLPLAVRPGQVLRLQPQPAMLQAFGADGRNIGAAKPLPKG
jgi:lactose/L-arabinose transport system ATP-binding protein